MASGENTDPLLQICWNDFDALGFDLDHTIARYKLPNQSKLCYRSIAQNVRETKGYNSIEHVDDSFATDFMKRGLIFDVPTGYLLKLNSQGKILRACHGTKRVSDEEITMFFGESRHYDEDKFTFVRDHCTGHDTAKMFDNNFYTPSMSVMAKMVDEKPSSDTYSNMIAGAIHSFNPAHFELKKGNYFPVIADNPTEYVHPVSSELKSWLLEYRKRGKITYIVTASFVDYALLVLNTCLQDDWQKYFDFLVCDARKPGFFTEKPTAKPFTRWNTDHSCIVSHQGLLERGGIYLNGSGSVLHKSLKSLLNKDDITCAYVGDSLASDVVPSFKSKLFHSIAVVEEVETERIIDPGSSDCPPAEKKLKTEYFASYAYSEPWGSVFLDDSSDGKQEKTVFTHILETCSLITIPTVEVLTRCSGDTKINTFRNSDKSLGFFPQPPQVMK